MADIEKRHVATEGHFAPEVPKNEAADLYGDAELAERMGYVKRGYVGNYLYIYNLYLLDRRTV